MKVSWEMASTAGIESTAKTKSVISMHIRHSSRGVAFFAPFTWHNDNTQRIVTDSPHD